MVGEHPGGRRSHPGVRGQGRADHTAQLPGGPGRLEELEVEGGVQLVRADVGRQPGRTTHPRLGHERARRGVALGDGPPAAVDLVHPGLVPVGMVQLGVGVVVEREPEAGDVGQAGVLDQAVGHVDPEAIHAAVEPELQCGLELLPDVRAAPVHVRLLRGEQVQVPLAGRAVGVGRPAPGRAAEGALPVVRGQVSAGAASLPEHEPLPLRRPRTGGQRLAEPRVLVREVVRDDVDDHLDAELVRLGDHRVGVGEGAEDGLDVAVVGDVVAGVLHGRGVPGADPDRVHAEGRQVGQPGPDAGDVADAVAVAVGVAARVDLVDDRRTPPGLGVLAVARVGRSGGKRHGGLSLPVQWL